MSFADIGGVDPDWGVRVDPDGGVGIDPVGCQG